MIPWRVREFSKIVLNVYQEAKVGVLRLLGVVDFPVPPNSNMRRTSARTIKDYFSSSLTTYAPIVTMARWFGVRFDGSTKVLDFGCGSGSQLMSFTRYFPDAQYFACDVDPSAIKFVKKNYPHVSASASGFVPPLNIAGREMDLVYSVSTFSHFDLLTQRLWLKELYRIIKPGGLVLLTIEGWRSLNSLAAESNTDLAEITDILRSEGIFYKEYVWLKELQRRGPALSPEVDMSTYFGDTYGHTIMTPEFVRRNWTADGFAILGFAEGVIAARQDLVVLQRPLDS